MSDVLGSAAAGPAAVRGGALRVAALGASLLIGLVYVPVLFGALGVVDGGRYVLVVAIATLALGVADAGLAPIAARELAVRGPGEQSAVVRALLGLRLALAAVGVALAVAYAVATGLPGHLVAGTAIAGVAALAGSVHALQAGVLSVRLRLGAVAAADLARQLATAAGVLVLALAGAGLLAYVVNLAVAAVAGLALMAALAGRALPWRPALAPAAWRALLRGALPLALATALGVVHLRLGLLLVERLSTPRELGLYGLSFRVFEVLVVVPQLMVQAALPLLAHAARETGPRFAGGVAQTATACLLAGVPLALVLVVGAPAVVELLGPPDAAPAAPVLRLHALALVATFATATASYALLARRRLRAVLAQVAAAVIATAATGALLVPGGGAQGAAAATAFGELAACLAGWALLARGPGGVRPPAGALARVAAAAAAGLLPALVLPALPAAVAGAAVFAVAALALGAVPAPLLAALRGR